MNVEQKHNQIVRLVIFIGLFIVLIFGAAYAVVQNLSYNTENVIASLGNRPIFTSTSTDTITMENISYIPETSETEYEIANATANLSVALSTDYSANTVCTYDIVWKWHWYDPVTGDTLGTPYVKTAGATKEFTVSGVSSNGNSFSEVQLGDCSISSLTTKIGEGSIESINGALTTDNWTFTTHFYKTQAVQEGHRGNEYQGKIYVDNVKCSQGSLLAKYLVNDAPKSGTDAVSNSPWILTSDHPGEYRYAGKNPDNYVQFNGELWRIIGIMPNMEYCTGTYGTETECDTTSTGSLIKIIRNQTISSSGLRWDYKTGVGSSTTAYGSNDWSDSQLMLMLNGTNYLKTGYDVNGTKLHTSYTITNNIVAGNGYNYYDATYSYLDGSGQAVYVPSITAASGYTATSGTVYKKIESTALNQIATVKWDLYGTNSYTTRAEGNPAALYNKERNIGSSGAVYTKASLPENRPVYWYGKIGLMYPSDYGYATNGGTTYNRISCLGYLMYGWDSGDYKTDCAGGSYLWYTNITSTAPGSSGTDQWTISPYSGSPSNGFCVGSDGHLYNLASNVAFWVRPVLYLKAYTVFNGGSGTWNNPYLIG